MTNDVTAAPNMNDTRDSDWSNMTSAPGDGSEMTSAGEALRVAVVATLLGAVMLAAAVGNVMVVVSVLRYRRLRILANSFIVSLAFADLLVALLVMPFSASQVCCLIN